MQGCHARMPCKDAMQKALLRLPGGIPSWDGWQFLLSGLPKPGNYEKQNKPWLNKLLLWSDDSAGIWEHHSWHESWHQQWPCWLQQIPRFRSWFTWQWIVNPYISEATHQWLLIPVNRFKVLCPVLHWRLLCSRNDAHFCNLCSLATRRIMEQLP